MSFCRMLQPQAEGSKKHWRSQWHPTEQPVDVNRYHSTGDSADQSAFFAARQPPAESLYLAPWRVGFDCPGSFVTTSLRKDALCWTYKPNMCWSCRPNVSASWAISR